jgi:hypothetical protein
MRIENCRPLGHRELWTTEMRSYKLLWARGHEAGKLWMTLELYL